MSMDKPISVGDLVQIIKPTHCCHNTDPIGEVHRVVSDRDRKPLMQCRFCLGIREHSHAITVAIDTGWYVDRDRLKRIPPLSELEGEKRDEKLTKPA